MSFFVPDVRFARLDNALLGRPPPLSCLGSATVVRRAMMEYGQSSGMVNVDGTMMPDPTKHPELEAMVRPKSPTIPDASDQTCIPIS